jgi:hypothetical protein
MSQLINSPFQGSITANGTAEIETVEQQSYSIIGGAHYHIEYDIADVLACFTVSEETDPSSNVLLNVDVGAGKLGDLKTALAAAFQGGSVTNGSLTTVAPAPSAGVLIEAVLAAVHEGIFNASLDENGVNAALEASAVKDHKFTDFSGNVETGCNTLADDINDAGAADSRRLLALQFPVSRYNALSAETFSSVLPFASGDKLRIRFTVDSTFVLSNDPQTLVGVVGDGTATGDIAVLGAPDANNGGATTAAVTANGAFAAGEVTSSNTEQWIIDLYLAKA